MRASLGRRTCLILIAAAILCPTPVATAQDATSDSLAFFENRIRPLLLDRCVKCHGPKKTESGLRLDTMPAMLMGGDSGPALIPGRPSESLIIQAVQHLEGMEMPPDGKLEDREVAALIRWVRADAVWPDGMMLAGPGAQLRSGPITDEERNFWSLQPIADPHPPAVDPSLTVRNETDRFVHARLTRAGLQTRAAASKRVLIRRATFDLTGLPPTPEEISEFLDDTSPQAFQRVVDRLLGTQQYGERWGRHWLDVVRFADTAGETGDYPTPLSWKYRNWVIDAFNDDKPYDNFIREQLAGDIAANQSEDISPEEYREMLTATGFIAISRRFGFDAENYHHLTIQDTIDTVGQAVLGLSPGCARCHDHKFDPISMRDYYAWYGIFESTRYSFPGSEEKKRPYDSFPVLPAAEADRVKTEYDATLAKLDADILHLESERKSLSGGWRTYIIDRRLRNPVENRDGHPGFHVWHGDPLPLVGINTSEQLLEVPGLVAPGKLVVHPLEKKGVGIAWRSSFAGVVRVSGRIQDVHDCGDSVAWYIDHLSSGGMRGIASGATERFSSDVIEPVEVAVKPGEFLQLAIMPKTHYGCDLTQIDLTISDLDGDRRWNLVEDVREEFVKANPHSDQFGNPDVWFYFTVDQDRGAAFGKTASVAANVDSVASQKKLDRLTKQLVDLRTRQEAMKKSDPYEVIYGAMEQDHPKDAQVHIRGNPKKPGETVRRRNLEILGGDRLRNEGGSGRLELAEWLTRQGNPLTPRVIVNRIWQHHFGRGLVATENDFGTRGERPSHPKLLDWLASRFVERGWSIKAIHRLIMASAVYQQSSAFDFLSAEADPEARLLWRFNRRRLSAEEIRDAMLFVDGSLDLTRGTEHPFPPIDTWAFTQHAPYYGVYPTKRRSIYLMQQRLKRHPFLSLFDGADVNVSTARRTLTTVPTQSLYLMNSEFVHECSIGFARRVLSEEIISNRISLAYAMSLGRQPTPAEIRATETFVTEYRTALVRTDDQNDPDGELRAWAGFIRTLLTRNEFLFLD
jgi:mono/diheme cytochrome c family protein